MIRPSRQTVHLESVREETPDVRTFVFSINYDLEPGQFVNIEFADSGTIGRRSFSIASGPGERLELTIKRVGTFTEAIFSSPIGTEFEILGPLGLPYIRHRDSPYLLIAGGSGIAPFRSLLKDPRSADLTFTLIDSNKTYTDIIYREEMVSWNTKIIHTLTREEHEGMRSGRINTSIFREIPGLENYRAIICGPAGLVTSAIDELTSLGIPMDRIKTESWGN